MLSLGDSKFQSSNISTKWQKIYVVSKNTTKKYERHVSPLLEITKENLER